MDMVVEKRGVLVGPGEVTNTNTITITITITKHFSEGSSHVEHSQLFRDG